MKPHIIGVISHKGISIVSYTPTFISEETRVKITLSVYKNFLLNPPLTTQNMNMVVDRRAVESMIIIISTILSHLLIMSKGKRKMNDKNGRGSLALKIANSLFVR